MNFILRFDFVVSVLFYLLLLFLLSLLVLLHICLHIIRYSIFDINKLYAFHHGIFIVAERIFISLEKKISK